LVCASERPPQVGQLEAFLGGEIMPKVALNTPAPDFTLLDFKGESIRLSEFRGKKYILLVFNRGFA
jgi:hypothetical protein